MNIILEEISKIGIVPVIKLEDATNAVPLAKALIEGGIPCAEVTFRTDAAEESIHRIAEGCPDMLVGAGTVLTIEQAERAINAGAKFIVSPGLNPKVVSYCLEKEIPITPGCATPSDIEQAMELGLDVVKFFPAEAAGGLPMIKAMSAPYATIKFMPTGGISLDNLNEYLSYKKVIACGGSWMVKPEMIAARDYAGIAKLAKEAVERMLGFEIAHVGINMENENVADQLSNSLSNLFGFQKKNGSSSIFVGDGLEIMKGKYLGKMGHIAICTNDIIRAVYHLERCGYQFDYDTVKQDVKGQFSAIYFADEFGGFAFHLMQKK